jgi:hypothetical protein
VKYIPSLAIIIVLMGLPVAAETQDIAPMALNSYSALPDGINTAIVIDQQGTTLGIVSKVETNSAGAPLQVDVLMPGGRQWAVKASAASYDSMAHRVIAETGALQTAQTAHDPAAKQR